MAVGLVALLVIAVANTWIVWMILVELRHPPVAVAANVRRVRATQTASEDGGVLGLDGRV